MSQSDYILLGKISGAAGLKGLVKVFSHTEPRVQITQYKQWFIQGRGLQKNRHMDEDWRTVKVISGRVQGKNIVAQLEGINDRNQAEALVGSVIAIKSDQLKQLDDGEYYWKDLIGLSVVTTEGVELGKVDWIFNSGSNDVLLVKDDVKDNGEKRTERMLPFLLNDVIISVDLEKSLMVVDWDPEF